MLRRYGLAITILATAAAPAVAAPSISKYTTLGSYMAALNAATDAPSQAIRQQIADGKTDLARALAAAKESGLVVSAPAAPVPADQNATQLYTEWTRERKQENVAFPDYAETLSSRYSYTPAQLASVQSLIDSHGALFALLQRAAAMPRLQTVNGDFHYMASIREGARELKSESYLQAHEDRFADAVHTDALVFHIATQLTDQPTVVRYLVAQAIAAIGIAGARDILIQAGPNPSVDVAVLRMLRDGNLDFPMPETLAGEVTEDVAQAARLRAYPEDAFADEFNSLIQPGPRPAALNPDQRKFTENAIDAAEADELQRAIDLWKALHSQSPERAEAVASVTRRIQAETAESDQNLCRAMVVDIAMLLATHDKAYREFQEQEEVAMAAATILAERGKTGHFPVLLPDGLVDPLTQRPLVYRTEGADGFVVYSVGPDGKNEGLSSEQDSHLRALTFRWPAPAPGPLPAWMR